MGYLLFQITLFVYIISTAAYMVYFWSQRRETRLAAEEVLSAAAEPRPRQARKVPSGSAK